MTRKGWSRRSSTMCPERIQDSVGLPITFLSDYGDADEFAGVCRVVIERLAPGSVVIDLTHGIPAGDIRRGALALEAAAGMAGPSVHLAVVDPGVGTKRRAVALAAGDSFLVGPDNGLLLLAAARLGGVDAAVEVSETSLALQPITSTFHGRDLFAPVAAHLASGGALALAGASIPVDRLIELSLPSPVAGEDGLLCHVLYADRFGNLILDARADDLADLGAEIVLAVAGRTAQATRGSTFADGDGGLVVYDDSSGRLAIALDGGSAAASLGAGQDAEVSLGPG